jgi:hypothetical protein
MFSIRGLIILGAISGFLVQVYQISDQYLRYQTRTQVYIRIPEKAVFHNLVVCIAFNDLLDAVKLHQEAGINLTQPQTFFQTIEDSIPVTIRQVLEYTPKVEDVLDFCLVRTGNLLMEMRRWKECHQFFNVTKYMTQEFICYNIKPAELPVLDLRHVTKSQNFAFGVYCVELTKAVKDVRLLNTIAFTGDYPFISSDFSAFSLVAGNTGASNMSINVFDVFSADVQVHQLPSPFDTMCQPISSDKQDVCKYECLKERLKLEKRIYPNIIIPEPIDYKIIGQADLKNKEIEAFVSKHDEECHRKCFFNPCITSYTKTSVSAAFDPEVTLAFTMRSPTEPDLLSKSEAVMTFVEYFSLMCSCLSTWFGVCFLSLDPFQFSAGRKYLQKIMIRKTPVLITHQLGNHADRFPKNEY